MLSPEHLFHGGVIADAEQQGLAAAGGCGGGGTADSRCLGFTCLQAWIALCDAAAGVHMKPVAGFAQVDRHG